MQKVILGMIVATCLWTSEASAITITYTGTITANNLAVGVTAGPATDNIGLFGAPGGSLDGASFVLTYTFDLNADYFRTFSSGTASGVFGGSTNQAPSIGDALLSINGMSIDLQGDFRSLYSRGVGIGANYIDVSVDGTLVGSNNITGDIDVLATDPTIPLALGSSFVIPVFIPPSGAQGNFALNDGDNIWTFGLLSEVNVSVSTAVPEVSTWAMMLLGFLGLGFAGYRKRLQLVA